MVIVAADTQGDLVYSVGICHGNQSEGEDEVKMEAVRAMVVSNVGDTVAASTPAPRRRSISILGMGAKDRATGPRHPGQAVEFKVS